MFWDFDEEAVFKSTSTPWARPDVSFGSYPKELKEARSVFGCTEVYGVHGVAPSSSSDRDGSPKSTPVLTGSQGGAVPPLETSPGSGAPAAAAVLHPWELHQRKVARLPVPKLADTIDLYLKSLEGLVDPEEYLQAKEVAEDFKDSNTAASLQKLLEERAANVNIHPSWLEEYWDDAYLCSRDPIPINVNYLFALQPHIKGKKYMTQCGRAASLIHAAAKVCLMIRHRTLSVDKERDVPLCMSQCRRVFCSSRIPQIGRDKIITYGKTPLTFDEQMSRTTEYDARRDPRHVVVMMRNRLFKLYVMTKTYEDAVASAGGEAASITPNKKDVNQKEVVLPVSVILEQLCTIAHLVRSEKGGGPPVGVLTAVNRDEWAKRRKELIELSPDNTVNLEAIQSALLVVCLDAINVEDLGEHARLLLHGVGTNRWFDRHNLIVSSNGEAGVNWEHSVGDGITTLRVADMMYQIDAEVCPTAEEVEACMESVEECALARTSSGTETTPPPLQLQLCPTDVNAPEVLKGQRLFVELTWKVDANVDAALRSAYNSFKGLIESNETSVLKFTRFGGSYLKNAKFSPDAFVQVAFQQTYFRLFGHCGATYEAASTRMFLHGRTETVRSVSRASTDFCQCSSVEPIFARRFGSNVPDPLQQLRHAVEAHVSYMKRAKSALGVDRHLFGLRMLAAEHHLPLHPFFSDPCLAKSTHWRMSTSHCGSSSLKLFGFGPVVGDGFGIGYMIKNDEITFVVTSKYTKRLTSSAVFCDMLESSLLKMRCLIEADIDKRRTDKSKTLHFTHPTSFTEFEYDTVAGFRYSTRKAGSISGKNHPIAPHIDD